MLSYGLDAVGLMSKNLKGVENALDILDLQRDITLPDCFFIPDRESLGKCDLSVRDEFLDTVMKLTDKYIVQELPYWVFEESKQVRKQLAIHCYLELLKDININEPFLKAILQIKFLNQLIPLDELISRREKIKEYCRNQLLTDQSIILSPTLPCGRIVKEIKELQIFLCISNLLDLRSLSTPFTKNLSLSISSFGSIGLLFNSLKILNIAHTDNC